jgi:site-specific recombinase
VGAVLEATMRERVSALIGSDEVAPLAELVATIARDPAPSVEALLAVLANDLELAGGVRAYMGRLARRARITAALADLGPLPSHGLIAELRERIVAKVLPSHRPPHDLIEILHEIVRARRDATWLDAIDVGSLVSLARAFTPNDEVARSALALGTLTAIELCAHRIAAAGEDPGLHTFAPDAIDHDSPFLAQASEIVRLTSAHRARIEGASAPPDALDDRHARVLLAQCDDQLDRIVKSTPKTGATVRLTYEIERLRDLLTRVRLLLDTIDGDAAWPARVELVRQLAHARAERDHTTPLLARGARLVAIEIVSHAGRAGEHYITRTPIEYARMWRAAAGAGLIVGLLAATKVGLAALHAPLLITAALFSANYSLGFLAVQALGLTIATKQPSMTAAALASSIDGADPGATRRLIDTILCLVRSQLAAIAGNVLLALPTALLLSTGFALLFGEPVASVEKAEHLVHELDPFRSGAIPHAAIAGLWLALSGIAAGYVSNTVIARHVPERIAQSRPLTKWLGEHNTTRLARLVERGAGAAAGCIVLGTMLGSTAIVGSLFGLPIDIRHVSFASANLGLAIATLGVDGVHLGTSLLGVAAIGATNLAVSFGVSLALALRARGVRPRQMPGLARDLARAFVREFPAWIVPVGATARVSPPARP